MTASLDTYEDASHSVAGWAAQADASAETKRFSTDRPASRMSATYASRRPLSAYQPLEHDQSQRSFSQIAQARQTSVASATSIPQLTFKSADLRSALHLHEALKHKLYMEGYLLVRHALSVDGQPAGRPEHFQTWTECFVQLNGTVLCIWNAHELQRAEEEGREIPPSFINVTDALVDFIGLHVEAPFSDPGNRRHLFHAFAVNSAGNNRILFCFSAPPPCDPALVQQRLSPRYRGRPEQTHVVEWLNLGHRVLQAWINAIRLASWERMRLDEIYTGALIRARLSALKYAQPGAKESAELFVRSPLTRGKHEGWVRARFMGSTEWRLCWMVLQSHWHEEESASALRRFFRLGGTVEQQGPPPPPSGTVASSAVAHLYESKKAKKPLASLWHVRHAYAVYPSRPDLVEGSVLFKVEGAVPQSAALSATHAQRKTGWVMFMPELKAPHARGANADMMKWIIAFMDAFRLYGRPGSFAWDARNPASPFFAYPIGPHKDHLFLDRALTEFLDITVEDHLSTRHQLHDVMAARMRGEDTVLLPPLVETGPVSVSRKPTAAGRAVQAKIQADREAKLAAQKGPSAPVTAAVDQGVPHQRHSVQLPRAQERIEEPARHSFQAPRSRPISQVITASAFKLKNIRTGKKSADALASAELPLSSGGSDRTEPSAYSTSTRAEPGVYGGVEANERDALGAYGESRATEQGGGQKEGQEPYQEQEPYPSQGTETALYQEQEPYSSQGASMYQEQAHVWHLAQNEAGYSPPVAQEQRVVHDALPNDTLDPWTAQAPAPSQVHAAAKAKPIQTAPTPRDEWFDYMGSSTWASDDTHMWTDKARETQRAEASVNPRHDQVYAWPIVESTANAPPMPPPANDAAQPPQHKSQELTPITEASPNAPTIRSDPWRSPLKGAPFRTAHAERFAMPAASPVSPAIPTSLSFLAPSADPELEKSSPVQRIVVVSPTKPARTESRASPTHNPGLQMSPEKSASSMSKGTSASTASPPKSAPAMLLGKHALPPKSTNPFDVPDAASTAPSYLPSVDAGRRLVSTASVEHSTDSHEARILQHYVDNPSVLPSPDLPAFIPNPTARHSIVKPIQAPAEPVQDSSASVPDEESVASYYEAPPEAQPPQPRTYPSSFGRNKQHSTDSEALQHTRPGRLSQAPRAAHAQDWVDRDEFETSEEPARTSLLFPPSTSNSSPFVDAHSTVHASTHGHAAFASLPTPQPRTTTPSASPMRASASSSSLGMDRPRQTFVKLEPHEHPGKQQHLASRLLGSASQERLDRSTRSAEQDSGHVLVNVPNKPPPPAAGLMGAIHSRDRKTRPSSVASTARTGHSPQGLSQQQMMINMYHWQQQQMMMMMGMSPPAVPAAASPQQMQAQQQAMLAAQQAYMQAMSHAGTGMPMPFGAPGTGYASPPTPETASRSSYRVPSPSKESSSHGVSRQAHMQSSRSYASQMSATGSRTSLREGA
ncbi:hypothetical protein MVES1_003718 [Malassezia vespertilionis]|uniref:Skg3/CAF120-like PH-like domain-containing protein n=1 Tax=Malassezia vespertilionis TaxID=2020962 RepID=A0A2N1J8H9_9BASI|nr:uncharacterized protein MVES1_003718 [Malassezia vespertilionis]PKI82844.1 hypothetical protein MVES_003278 [Malassezia vespertilionis]WFD08346.1 hypothetical protein MVES1_003718 [Malassezia vespertilionis]